MKNEFWYGLLMHSEDNDWSTGSFLKAEAVKMAAEKGAERIAVIKGDYVDGEPTSDPICVEELTCGEDVLGRATYYFYRTEDFNGILVTDGYVAFDCSIDSDGQDTTTLIDVYRPDAVDRLKSAYTKLAREDNLFNFADALKWYPSFFNSLMIFQPEYYQELVELTEVE